MIEDVLKAVHARLFANSELTAIVGNRIQYARAPIGTTYPQVIYFDVASRTEAVADYDKVTVQFSAWSSDKFEALRLNKLLYEMWLRYTGTVDIGGGEELRVNWTQLVDQSALPQDDPQLFGYQLRFEIRAKGANIGA